MLIVHELINHAFPSLFDRPSTSVVALRVGTFGLRHIYSDALNSAAAQQRQAPASPTNRKLLAEQSVDGWIKCLSTGKSCKISAQCCKGSFCNNAEECEAGKDPNPHSSSYYLGQASDKPSTCGSPRATCTLDSQCCQGNHCTWGGVCEQGAPGFSISTALFGQDEEGCYPWGADCSDWPIRDPCCPGSYCKYSGSGKSACQI